MRPRLRLGVVLLHLLALGPSSAQAAGTSICVVLRCDDYSSRSDTQFELRMLDVFRRHGARVTFAVIPCVTAGDQHAPATRDDVAIPLTEEKAAILRNAVDSGVVEVAQHGCTHQTVCANCCTEFSGVGYEEQRRKISAGRALLASVTGREVTVFIPPWNQYDANTLRILEEMGYKGLSADPAGPLAAAGELKHLPETCRLARLKWAVQQARKTELSAVLVVAIFHNYDFRESDPRRGVMSLADLDATLEWVRSQPDVRITTFQEAISSVEGLGADRLRQVQAFRAAGERKYLPEQLSVYSVVLFPYLPASPRALSAAATRLHVLVLVFWTTTAASLFLGAYACGRLRCRAIHLGWWPWAAALAWLGICITQLLTFRSSETPFRVSFGLLCVLFPAAAYRIGMRGWRAAKAVDGGCGRAAKTVN